jgi:hypothetical protein
LFVVVALIVIVEEEVFLKVKARKNSFTVISEKLNFKDLGKLGISQF